MNLEPIGRDGYGAPLYAHQTTPCDFCGKPYESASAAENCCSTWDGRGWD